MTLVNLFRMSGLRRKTKWLNSLNGHQKFSLVPSFLTAGQPFWTPRGHHKRAYVWQPERTHLSAVGVGLPGFSPPRSLTSTTSQQCEIHTAPLPKRQAVFKSRKGKGAQKGQATQTRSIRHARPRPWRRCKQDSGHPRKVSMFRAPWSGLVLGWGPHGLQKST